MAGNSMKALEGAIGKGLTKHAALNEISGAGKMGKKKTKKTKVKKPRKVKLPG